MGEPMRRLLRQAVNHGIAPAFSARLLAASGAQEELDSKVAPALSSHRLSTAAVPMAQLDEPITEQEQRILRLNSAGLTNSEVAEELFLSVNTVKWYLKAI
jgi:DNA-binding NarL/FixJ family response regulator